MFSLVKKSLLTSLVAASGLMAHAETVSINIPLQVEKLEVNLACVRYVNSSGESAGVQFIYNSDSYAEVAKFRDKKLNSIRFIDGNFCDVQNTGKGIPVLQVPDNASMKEVQQLIREGNGYTAAWLAFYSDAELKESLNTELDSLK